MTEHIGHIGGQIDGGLPTYMMRLPLVAAPDNRQSWPAYQARWAEQQEELHSDEAGFLGSLADETKQKLHLRMTAALGYAGEYADAVEASRCLRTAFLRYPEGSHDKGTLQRWHRAEYHLVKNLLRLGRLEEAEDILTEAHVRQTDNLSMNLEEQNQLNAGDVASEHTYDSLRVQLLAYKQDLPAAERLQRANVRRLVESLGTGHPETLAAHSNLAHILRMQGKHQRAAGLSFAVAQSYDDLKFFGRDYFLTVRNNFYGLLDVAIVAPNIEERAAAVYTLETELFRQQGGSSSHIDTLLMQRDFASAAGFFALDIFNLLGRVKQPEPGSSSSEHPYMKDDPVRLMVAFSQLAVRHATQAYEGLLQKNGLVTPDFVHPEVITAYDVMMLSDRYNRTVGQLQEPPSPTIFAEDQPHMVFRTIF